MVIVRLPVGAAVAGGVQPRAGTWAGAAPAPAPVGGAGRPGARVAGRPRPPRHTLAGSAAAGAVTPVSGSVYAPAAARTYTVSPTRTSRRPADSRVSWANTSGAPATEASTRTSKPRR